MVVFLAQLPEDLRRNASVTLAIGPEGGWTEEEVEAFEAAGWRMGGIGTRVLTTETACLTAVALCQDAINDAA